MSLKTPQPEHAVPGRRRIVVWWALAVLLAGIGGVLAGVGIAGQQHAPQPTAAQANPVALTVTTTVSATTTTSAQLSAIARPSTSGSRSVRTTPTSSTRSAPRPADPAAAATPTSTPSPTPLTLSTSAPQSISIPSIGVQSTLLQLGLNPDNSIQVPPLQDPNSQAGWYKYSSTPGQIGPAVILGHVDSAQYGPGVFYKLGALQPGATVSITLTDRVVAVFTVQRVVAYPKSAFPSAAVYGQIDQPGLRLITCGGTFDPEAGSYESNIVAYANLTSSHSREDH